MPRKRARTEEGQFVADNPATTDVNEAWVETVNEEIKPAVSEVKDETPAPVEAPKAVEKQEIETDVTKKLQKKTEDNTNPFVPQNSAALEKEAKRVAEEKGFDLNRGTSIGARLMARRLLG